MKKSRAIAILVIFFVLLAGITFIDFKGIDGNGKEAASDITLGLDLAGGVSITYQVVGESEPSKTDMSDTIYKLQQRVYDYSTEALVYQEGRNRINVEIPGVSDAEAILAELGKPGQLYFIYENGPDGSKNFQETYQTDSQGNYYMSYQMNKSIEELLAEGSIPLVGTDVANAQAAGSKDNMDNIEYCVSLVMTVEGKDKFSEATTRCALTGERLAIYYDDAIISAPSVSEPLTTGQAQINGNFTYESADLLASRIRIGGLSLELEELHSKVVGAQLGSNAISTSLKAGVIGLGVIVVFMIAVYFLGGFAASLALLLYTALIVLLLNGFGMTLTLPGIAGIILSIGMAVDANVIIFARIREEIATGKTVKSSIKIGFDKALSAIIDGNVTTLIAAAVLWILGSGSIKGFAQTLVLGIVLSMFTALVVTRLLINALYALGLKSEKLYGRAKAPRIFNFVGKKTVFFAISLALILAGCVTMIVNQSMKHGGDNGRALNLSLDFVGGTSTTVTFNNEYNLSEIEKQIIPELEAIVGSSVQPQPVTGTGEVVFKSNWLTPEQRSAIEDMLIANYGITSAQIQTENISSTISGETTRNTIIAVIVAVICMLIYIRIRFKDIRFGAAGVLALVHDVLVVLAFYAIAWVSVGSTFIACMLTIVGYSINATIVVFDRVRENHKLMGSDTPLKDIINTSISQTLSRSIFTSLTTFIMVCALYILGVTAIREFALPLMVGILSGTYSSIFVAGGLYFLFTGNGKNTAPLRLFGKKSK